MAWFWQRRVRGNCGFWARPRRFFRVPRCPEATRWQPWNIFAVCCCLGVLVVMAGGCAGKPKPKPKPTVAEISVAAPSEPAAQRLREAIGYYLGADYKFGGNSKEATDCSGFIQQVYSRAGLKVPRTSQLQYQSGKSISSNDLQYGDLVFFNQYCQGKYYPYTASILSGTLPKIEKPSHVGIYIGNGRFVHATASKGGVNISNLNEDCWKRSLIGIKRYLPE